MELMQLCAETCSGYKYYGTQFRNEVSRFIIGVTPYGGVVLALDRTWGSDVCRRVPQRTQGKSTWKYGPSQNTWILVDATL